jgi:hypothetical protein
LISKQKVPIKFHARSEALSETAKEGRDEVVMGKEKLPDPRAELTPPNPRLVNFREPHNTFHNLDIAQYAPLSTRASP